MGLLSNAKLKQKPSASFVICPILPTVQNCVILGLSQSHLFRVAIQAICQTSTHLLLSCLIFVHNLCLRCLERGFELKHLLAVYPSLKHFQVGFSPLIFLIPHSCQQGNKCQGIPEAKLLTNFAVKGNSIRQQIFKIFR